MGLILLFISFIISALPSLFLSAPPVEDALGTMGAAAYLAGYDWSSFLSTDGFFYKYGMTCFYLPAFLFIKDPVIRYKFLLCCNSALDAFIPVLIFRISKKHFGFEKEESFWLSLICGMMPSVLLYTKYTWAEPALFLVPWVIIYLLLELYSAGTDSGRKKNMLSATLGFICVYAFMCHQRGIIIVLSTLLTLLLIRIMAKRTLVSGRFFGISFIVSILLDRVCNHLLREYVYLGIKPAYNLLDSFFDPQLYRELFSLSGQIVLIKSFCGWMMNVCVSGMGITMIGIIAGTVSVFGFASRRSKGASLERFSIISLFSLLTFAGAFLLGLLFFFRTAMAYWDGTAVSRCDHLVFGRYLESMYPVLMYMGTYSLIAKKERITPKSVYPATALYMFFSLYFGVRIAPAMKGADCYVHSLMSMNYCFDARSVTMTQDVIDNLPTALIIACIVSFIIFVIILVLSHSGNFRLCAMILLSCFLYIYVVSFVNIILKVDACCATRYATFYLGYG
ncbi:hypothetical protein [Butyrivibrio sp. XPD2006]|uniref:hypothetical protein n=1 Tax=Butyrivibrio sp. XPD2006 TaxID=1280668 RepID=UPI00042575F0|nr:hypothetical protein [Butyrivibrio sp. XPD2006]